jgi:hypothetical protein
MRGFSRHRTSFIPLLIGTLLVLIGGVQLRNASPD